MTISFGLFRVCGLLMCLWVLSACKAAPTIAVTEARDVIVLTQPFVQVTSTPRPTPTLAPTATLPYDISPLEGRWQADFNYRLRGYPIFNDIRYSGSFEVNVNLQGAISGTGTLYTTLDQPPCRAITREGASLDATLEGQLSLDKATNEVIGEVTLKPRDLASTQLFELLCADAEHTQQAVVSILWSALAATDQLHFRAAFKPGLAVSDLRNLSGASGGTLHGILTTEIRLSH